MCGQNVWPHYVRDVAVPCGFARPWWKVRLHGAVPLGTQYRAIGLLLGCGQTVWRITSVMSQGHIYAALVESAFAWGRATGECETCWCKRGVSLVSAMIGGIV